LLTNDFAMAELDFKTFGITPNDRCLLLRILKALNDQQIEWAENVAVMSVEKLLKAYIRMWHLRSHLRVFFTCSGIKRPLDHALLHRQEIESVARVSTLCSAALLIFHEYDVYSVQWSETRKHIEAQRMLLHSKRRNRFLAELEKLSGAVCAACRATENLHLDHIKPVSLGGTSVLENLQLLCASHNYKKGRNEKRYSQNKDAIYRRHAAVAQLACLSATLLAGEGSCERIIPNVIGLFRGPVEKSLMRVAESSSRNLFPAIINFHEHTS
jgi:5-methylcytosine-specific restriction endonuclease McrA